MLDTTKHITIIVCDRFLLKELFMQGPRADKDSYVFIIFLQNIMKTWQIHVSPPPHEYIPEWKSSIHTFDNQMTMVLLVRNISNVVYCVFLYLIYCMKDSFILHSLDMVNLFLHQQVLPHPNYPSLLEQYQISQHCFMYVALFRK